MIAIFFLLRSMVRKIKKVPASFDPPDEDAVDPAVADTVAPEHRPMPPDIAASNADPGATDLAHEHSG